jgi:GntR family phosphonate transport system transcriptional regulator
VGDPVALSERLGLADGQAISIATSFFPCSLLPDILSQLQTTPSLSHILRQIYGMDHLRLRTQVSARTVKTMDAAHLGLPLNAPILLVESVNVNQQGQVIEYGVTRFRGDRMELVFENDLNPTNGSQ